MGRAPNGRVRALAKRPPPPTVHTGRGTQGNGGRATTRADRHRARYARLLRGLPRTGIQVSAAMCDTTHQEREGRWSDLGRRADGPPRRRNCRQRCGPLHCCLRAGDSPARRTLTYPSLVVGVFFCQAACKRSETIVAGRVPRVRLLESRRAPSALPHTPSANA